MRNLNRFRLTDKPNVIKFLKGENVKVPRFAKRFKEELSVKNGEVFLDGKQILFAKDLESFLKKIVLKKSNIPLNRDQGYLAIVKNYLGVSRRKWQNFILSIAEIRQTDKILPTEQKGGKKIKKIATFEIDLLEVRKKKMPKHVVLKKNSFISTVVHTPSGLTSLRWLRTKKPRFATPLVVEQLKELCKKLKIPFSKGVTAYSDHGKEYNSEELGKSKVKHIEIKLGPSVEARNGFARRTLFKLLNLKRGGLAETIKQTQEIINNAASSIHKNLTPNEIAKHKPKEQLESYNAKRQSTKMAKRPKIPVGSRVRVNVKKTKDKFFKSSDGLQWSEPTKVYSVSSSRPWRYRVKIWVTVGNQWRKKYVFVPQDKIQKLPEKDVKIPGKKKSAKSAK